MGYTKEQRLVEYRRLVVAGLCPSCYKPAGDTVKCEVCRMRHSASKRKKNKECGVGRYNVTRTHYHMTPSEITKVCGMYLTERKSIAVIAAELNWPRSRIRNALVAGNAEIRTHKEVWASTDTRKQFDARPRPVRRSWKGGKRKTKAGYVHVWVNDPNHKRGGRYIFEHRLIWESTNGPLPRGWIIHHINGIKDDNRLVNLVACHKRDHASMWRFVCAHIQHLERELAELKTDVEAMRRQLTRDTKF